VVEKLADDLVLVGALVAPYEKPYDFAVAGDPRSFRDLLTADGLNFIKGYADGVGLGSRTWCAPWPTAWTVTATA